MCQCLQHGHIAVGGFDEQLCLPAAQGQRFEIRAARIDVVGGVSAPLGIAIPVMPTAEVTNTPAGRTDVLGQQLAQIVSTDLRNSGLFKPLAEMPASLREHIRYPEDIFAVQASVYATYHMTSPAVFYNKEDQWQVPVLEAGEHSTLAIQQKGKMRPLVIATEKRHPAFPESEVATRRADLITSIRQEEDDPDAKGRRRVMAPHATNVSEAPKPIDSGK